MFLDFDLHVYVYACKPSLVLILTLALMLTLILALVLETILTRVLTHPQSAFW